MRRLFVLFAVGVTLIVTGCIHAESVTRDFASADGTTPVRVEGEGYTLTLRAIEQRVIPFERPPANTNAETPPPPPARRLPPVAIFALDFINETTNEFVIAVTNIRASDERGVYTVYTADSFANAFPDEYSRERIEALFEGTERALQTLRTIGSACESIIEEGLIPGESAKALFIVMDDPSRLADALTITIPVTRVTRRTTRNGEPRYQGATTNIVFHLTQTFERKKRGSI